MRVAEIFMHDRSVGFLTEVGKGKEYVFEYHDKYDGPPISVTMPVDQKRYNYEKFPPFFEGLLPEGANLDMLLRSYKIDRDSLFDILLKVGEDTVGAVTVKEVANEAMSDNV